MENTTVVTALYNIQRETQGDGRRWEEYLQWFQETLQLPLPMVIFIPRSLEGFVATHRPVHYKTHVILQEIEEIPYAYCAPKIESILQNPSYQQRIRDPRRVECILPFYNILQYSKFRWLVQAVDKNPFDSTYFFWMDAGISRFIPPSVHRQTKPRIHLPENKLVIQHNHLLNQYPVHDEYLWDSQCLLCGTMFGGDRQALHMISAVLENYFVAFMNQGWVNNEQILLAYLQQKIVPNLFHLVYNDSGKHLGLFEKLFI